MKLGILADSHDNLPKIEKAVDFFNKNRVDFVLHAGDFIAPFTINKLKNLQCEWCGVFGNNDGERNGLSNISQGKIKEGPLRLELARKKVTLVHDISKIEPDKEDAQLIVFGHTHRPEILTKDGLLLINPGECGGWLTRKSSVILIDLVSLSATLFKI